MKSEKIVTGMTDNNFINLLNDIRQLVVEARKTISRSVDLMQVTTNYKIGCRIVEHEQLGKARAVYGKQTLKELSSKLTAEFGRGFSEDSLSRMRKFYLMYGDRKSISATALRKLRRPAHDAIPALVETKSATALRKSQASCFPFCLSWSHYLLLMNITNTDERRFYEIEASTQNWSVRELERQFNSSLYERLALSRDKNGIHKLARHGQIVEKPSDLLKEPLVLEFLGLREESRYSETDLEAAIIDKIEHFLLELGKGFLFEARQKRFTFDEDHFFVDLVFYNRLLKSYVLIDLKIGKLTHQDLGQMQMYVNYFDRYVKLPAENPTVGIILCKEKKDTLVKITLPHAANIHAKEYQTYLPDKNELKAKLIEWVNAVDSGSKS
jgi:predicted nuclease of restriction endonuclease-like (RecB) superfamily